MFRSTRCHPDLGQKPTLKVPFLLPVSGNTNRWRCSPDLRVGQNLLEGRCPEILGTVHHQCPQQVRFTAHSRGRCRGLRVGLLVDLSFSDVFHRTRPGSAPEPHLLSSSLFQLLLHLSSTWKTWTGRFGGSDSEKTGADQHLPGGSPQGGGGQTFSGEPGGQVRTRGLCWCCCSC